MIARWSRAGLLGSAVLVTALRGGSYDVIPRHHLFVLVWWLLALGSLLGVLPRARPRTGLLVAAGALALLAAWTAAGLAWTESAERTSVEVARTLGLSGVLLLVGASFDRDDRRAAIAAVTAAAAVVCVVALFSRLAPDVLTSKLTEAGYQPRRLSYAFNYWNALGAWAAMTVALALGASAHAGRWWLRGAALAVLPVAGAVAYLTYSRTAVIALAAGVVVVVGLSSRRWLAAVHVLVGALGAAAVIAAIRATPGIADASGTGGAGTVALVAVAAALACAGAAWVTGGGRLEGFALPVATARRALAVAGVAGVVLLVLLGPGAASQAWDSFNRPLANPSGDLSSRLGSLSGERRRLWAVALDAFEREPVTGTGAGTYELVWNRDLRRSERVRDAHSLYLETLAELGVVGGLLLAAALGALGLAAARGALGRGPDRGVAAGCAGALAVFCLAAGVDWMWESTAVAVTALTCGALACAGGPVGPPRPRRRVAGLVVGLLAIATLLPGLVAATQLRDSEEDVRRGRPETALERTATAIGIQPWGASGFVQRALVLERLGLLREAAADARRATRKEPTDWQHWLLLARIDAQRGRIPEALRSAGRARALNPRAPVFRRR